MPAPLAIAAAAAGRAAAGRVAQAAATKTAQGAATRTAGQATARSGGAAMSGPQSVSARGSEFFNTERTLEQNIERRVSELRKRRWGRQSAQDRYEAVNDTVATANDDEDLAEELAIAQAEEDEARALSGVSALYKEHGQELTGADVAELKAETPKDKPHFPVLIFSLALMKDILDLPLDLSVVGAIIASVLAIVAGASIALWMLGKMTGAWYKRGMIKWFWRRFALVVFIEFVPGLQLIPANIILVWMAHNRENKAVQLLNQSLEMLHGRGYGPQRR